MHQFLRFIVRRSDTGCPKHAQLYLNDEQ